MQPKAPGSLTSFPVDMRLVPVQVVIALAEKYMRSADPRFPVGRTRLETVGVVACAVIMTIATIEVIQSALGDLYEGLAHGAASSHGLTVTPCTGRAP